MDDLFSVVTRYASTPSEKSGCDLCQMNIYLEETYYEIRDYDNELLMTFCELCRPKFVDKIKKLK